MNKEEKQAFPLNVRKLATGNDKEQLIDELLNLKNENGFSFLEILTAIKMYDEPTFKEERKFVLSQNIKKTMKVELLINDYNPYDETSIKDALKDLKSNRFDVKDVINII